MCARVCSPLFCMVLLEYRRLGLLSNEADRLALLALVVWYSVFPLVAQTITNRFRFYSMLTNKKKQHITFPKYSWVNLVVQKGPAMTLAELWIHPSGKIILKTNPVTSVLNQHYRRCLYNWVMFKLTKKGTSWLLWYVDTERLTGITASIWMHNHWIFWSYRQWQ